MENELTYSQKYVLEQVLSGKNVFITGKAGTGKTYLTKRIYDELTEQGKSVGLCASTGIAALNLSEAVGENVSTVHSLLGIPIGNSSPISIDIWDRYAFSIKQNRLDVISNFDCIIIDEISMLRLDAFGRAMCVLDKAQKHGKKKIQRIVIGDFLQLPPVVTKNDREGLKHLYNPSHMFAFDMTKEQARTYRQDDKDTHPIWNLQNFDGIELSEIIRQDDIVFAAALSRLRIGDTSPLKYLNEHVHVVSEAPNGVVSLFPLKKDVQELNNKKLEELVRNGEEQETYSAICTGTVSPKDFNSIAEVETLEVAKGARVMITANDSSDYRAYSNGSLGTYVGTKDNLMTIELDSGKQVVLDRVSREILGDWRVVNGKPKRDVVGTIKQYPIILAWGMTIHKSQGLTLDKAFISPGKIFTSGQLYVALSRLKSIDGIYLDEPLRPYMVKCDDRVKKIMVG